MNKFKPDKGALLIIISVLATGVATLTSFLATRAENEKAAEILPNYSDVESIIVKKKQ